MGSHWLHDIGYAIGDLRPDYYSGWETRSRSSGGFDKLLGVCIHHTASSASPESDMGFMWKNSADRPIGNIFLARDGRITVGTAGASNTQGKGGPVHCLNGTVPQNTGNNYLIAIEAANNGVGEPWSNEQTDSYVKLVQRLCMYYGFSPGQDVYGHFDYCAPSCPGRKLDPAGPSPFGSINSSGTWDIDSFRLAVAYDSSPIDPGPGPSPGSVQSHRPSLSLLARRRS